MPSEWSDYTQALVDKGLVSQCAIYSMGGTQWASSCPRFSITQQHFQHMMDGFQDPTELRTDGLEVGDVHFTLTRLSNRDCMMVARCSATGAGCVIYRCARCVIIATHEDALQPGMCYNAVERLGDFLLEKGY
ncbi:hypothetical protein BaRGS_00026517 [Batillaria attramentaria]|uniref:Profilin n=1 Tax=Batillaria attramentaria TaxID=370345 RepID=A0ABD0K4V1_9CAEN